MPTLPRLLRTPLCVSYRLSCIPVKPISLKRIGYCRTKRIRGIGVATMGQWGSCPPSPLSTVPLDVQLFNFVRSLQSRTNSGVHLHCGLLSSKNYFIQQILGKTVLRKICYRITIEYCSNYGIMEWMTHRIQTT